MSLSAGGITRRSWNTVIPPILAITPSLTKELTARRRSRKWSGQTAPVMFGALPAGQVYSSHRNHLPGRYRRTGGRWVTGVSAEDVYLLWMSPLGRLLGRLSGTYFTQSGGYGTNGLYHMSITGSASKTSPAVLPEAAGNGTTNGGLDGATGTFVDGLGNIWVANSPGGVSEFSFATGSFVALSPATSTVTSPTPPSAYGFGTSYLSGKTPSVRCRRFVRQPLDRVSGFGPSLSGGDRGSDDYAHLCHVAGGFRRRKARGANARFDYLLA